ncbi:MAG: TerB family tellurite resistance protein [Stenomitos rutilans HA7619-LM2]|jgi:uncharacterized membrane protein YebE (DUF533 family)|nr:TerB family tellurite resistance protein [Stenomitos rutilans HA7619-LM2]
MASNSDTKTLLKILIGVAWLDGQIQPEERTYLNRIVQEKGLENEPEIQPLIHEFRAVKPEECYAWVNDYLGDHPTSEGCQQLIEAISGLIYSDGVVDSAEAKMLTDLQQLNPASPSSDTGHSPVLNAIRSMYQRWISTLNS